MGHSWHSTRLRQSRALASAGIGLNLLCLMACSENSPQLRPPPATTLTSRPRIDDSRWVATSFSSLTLRHPASWKFVPVEMELAGPSGSLGFLTDQQPGKQCTYFTGGDSCGPPITKLATGKVMVTVTARYIGAADITRNSKIAGLPAQTSTPNIHTVCPADTTYDSAVAVQLPQRGTATTVYVTSCSASDTTASRAVIALMLSTATYQPR